MQIFNLNLVPGGVMHVINVSQYDIGRQFAFKLYDGESIYYAEGKTVEIRGAKPDGNGFAYNESDGAISKLNQTVTITTLAQMTVCAGDIPCELRISESGVILGTCNFILRVEPTALSDDTPISDTDIPAIERAGQAAVAQAQEAATAASNSATTASTKAGEASTSATNANANALKAEGYAVGKQNGTDVGSSSPYYHNNSKYFLDETRLSSGAAMAAAADAQNSKYDAEAYAVGKRNGSDIPSTDPAYHNNAKYYAESIGNDALVAEGYANGKQNGVPVGSGSPYYHNNAEYFKDLANVTSLVSMTDVDITNPATGDALVYDGTLGKWKNGEVEGVPAGGTTNQVLAKNSNTDGDTKWMDVLADIRTTDPGEGTTLATGRLLVVVEN